MDCDGKNDLCVNSPSLPPSLIHFSLYLFTSFPFTRSSSLIRSFPPGIFLFPGPFTSHLVTKSQSYFRNSLYTHTYAYDDTTFPSPRLETTLSTPQSTLFILMSLPLSSLVVLTLLSATPPTTLASPSPREVQAVDWSRPFGVQAIDLYGYKAFCSQTSMEALTNFPITPEREDGSFEVYSTVRAALHRTECLPETPSVHRDEVRICAFGVKQSAVVRTQHVDALSWSYDHVHQMQSSKVWASSVVLAPSPPQEITPPEAGGDEDDEIRLSLPFSFIQQPGVIQMTCAPENTLSQEQMYAPSFWDENWRRRQGFSPSSTNPPVVDELIEWSKQDIRNPFSALPVDLLGYTEFCSVDEAMSRLGAHPLMPDAADGALILSGHRNTPFLHPISLSSDRGKSAGAETTEYLRRTWQLGQLRVPGCQAEEHKGKEPVVCSVGIYHQEMKGLALMDARATAGEEDVDLLEGIYARKWDSTLILFSNDLLRVPGSLVRKKGALKITCRIKGRSTEKLGDPSLYSSNWPKLLGFRQQTGQ